MYPIAPASYYGDKNPYYTIFDYKIPPAQDAMTDVYIPNDYKTTTLNRNAHSELIPAPVFNDLQRQKVSQLSLSSHHYMNVGVSAGINIGGERSLRMLLTLRITSIAQVLVIQHFQVNV